MVQCYKRGASVVSGLIAISAAILVALAVGTKEWVKADIVRTINQQANSSPDKIKGGYKYFGLFNGCEEKKFGSYFGPRSRCFDALEEVNGFANIEKVYTTLVFCCIGMLTLIASAYLSFYIELVKSVPDWLESIFLNIVNAAAFSFVLVAVAVYAELFMNSFRKSILPPSDVRDGFSTEGKAELRYSYWLLVGACGLCFFNFIFMLLFSCRRLKTTSFVSNLTRSKKGGASVNKHPNGDGVGMMLY